MARQLQQSGDKIQELLKKQKDFLRDVSHEVRTPLARLQVAADTLELEIKDGRALKQIKAEVLIIDQLVQDLLHLSQFDRPMRSHKLETISVFYFSRSVYEKFKDSCEQKKHIIECPK